MTMLLEAPEEERTEITAEPCHFVCDHCYGPNFSTVPLLAFCGHDCSDEPMLDDSVECSPCVECAALTRCPVCGWSVKE